MPHPDVVLRLIRERCSGFVVLCTHVAHPDASSHGCTEEVVEYVGEHGTYRGRHFSERGPDPTVEQDNDLWAAWSNEGSFWPFEPDLVRMIEAAGFRSIDKVVPRRPLGAVAGRSDQSCHLSLQGLAARLVQFDVQALHGNKPGSNTAPPLAAGSESRRPPISSPSKARSSVTSKYILCAGSTGAPSSVYPSLVDDATPTGPHGSTETTTPDTGVEPTLIAE